MPSTSNSFTTKPLLALAALAAAAFCTVGAHAATTDRPSMTVASRFGPPGFPNTFSGYEQGSLGALTPATLTGGKTVTVFEDYASGGASRLSVSGFTASPGQSWLVSAGCTGLATKIGSTATYSYTSGVAQWNWSGSFGFFAQNGNTIPCAITHN